MSNNMKFFFIFIMPALGAFSLGMAAIMASTIYIGVSVAIGVWTLSAGLQVAIFYNKKNCDNKKTGG